jgi:hypothetical protein
VLSEDNRGSEIIRGPSRYGGIDGVADTKIYKGRIQVTAMLIGSARPAEISVYTYLKDSRGSDGT